MNDAEVQHTVGALVASLEEIAEAITKAGHVIGEGLQTFAEALTKPREP